MKVRQFKVIADTCGAAKKIYNCGDIVKESDFAPGQADAYVRKLFLKEIAPESPVSEPTKEQQQAEEDLSGLQTKGEILTDLRGEKEPEKSESTNDTYVDLQEQEIVVEESKYNMRPTEQPTATEKVNESESVSVDQIITDLKEHGVEFDANSSKQELYKLWLSI
jgi:hypothetical protein